MIWNLNVAIEGPKVWYLPTFVVAMTKDVPLCREPAMSKCPIMAYAGAKNVFEISHRARSQPLCRVPAMVLKYPTVLGASDVVKVSHYARSRWYCWNLPLCPESVVCWNIRFAWIKNVPFYWEPAVWKCPIVSIAYSCTIMPGACDVQMSPCAGSSSETLVV